MDVKPVAIRPDAQDRLWKVVRSYSEIDWKGVRLRDLRRVFSRPGCSSMRERGGILCLALKKAMEAIYGDAHVGMNSISVFQASAAGLAALDPDRNKVWLEVCALAHKEFARALDRLISIHGPNARLVDVMGAASRPDAERTDHKVGNDLVVDGSGKNPDAAAHGGDGNSGEVDSPAATSADGRVGDSALGEEGAAADTPDAPPQCGTAGKDSDEGACRGAADGAPEREGVPAEQGEGGPDEGTAGMGSHPEACQAAGDETPSDTDTCPDGGPAQAGGAEHLGDEAQERGKPARSEGEPQSAGAAGGGEKPVVAHGEAGTPDETDAFLTEDARALWRRISRRRYRDRERVRLPVILRTRNQGSIVREGMSERPRGARRPYAAVCRSCANNWIEEFEDALVSPLGKPYLLARALANALGVMGEATPRWDGRALVREMVSQRFSLDRCRRRESSVACIVALDVSTSTAMRQGSRLREEIYATVAQLPHIAPKATIITYSNTHPQHIYGAPIQDNEGITDDAQWWAWLAYRDARPIFFLGDEQGIPAFRAVETVRKRAPVVIDPGLCDSVQDVMALLEKAS